MEIYWKLQICCVCEMVQNGCRTSHSKTPQPRWLPFIITQKRVENFYGEFCGKCAIKCMKIECFVRISMKIEEKYGNNLYFCEWIFFINADNWCHSHAYYFFLCVYMNHVFVWWWKDRSDRCNAKSLVNYLFERNLKIDIFVNRIVARKQNLIIFLLNA